MANEFNIQQLTAQAHGYVGLPFPALELKGLTPDLNQIGKAIQGKNALGKPLFMDCVIDGVRLPNEPLITITGKDTIVETIIVGSERRGAVLEFINAGAFMIKIEGVCINPNKKEYPQEQVEAIKELIAEKTAKDLENDLAELFGINRIVIKDYGFGNMKGQPYSQSYYLSCVSDEDFYATLKRSTP